MNLKICAFLCALCMSVAVSAQWTAKASFPGTPRARSVSFTIGHKMYVMGGYANTGQVLKDFWEYNTDTDTWTQKPNFDGPERYGAAAFVIDTIGYIATGANDFGYLDDLWQYDPSNGNWTQLTSLPAGQPQHENQRTEAFVFVIGNKAYLGGGNGFVFGANSTSNIAFSDLWEYSKSSNSWFPKTGFPDFVGRDMAIAVTYNNLGYVGLGCNVQQNTNYTKFWAYDASTDSWAAKADFPTGFSVDAAAFTLDTSIYVVGGVNLTPVSLSNQFYKYSPSTDTWSSAGTFNGGSIAAPFVAVSGGKAFLGTGFDGGLNPRSDVWQFPTAVVPNGIHELSTQGNITVYPNPAHDYITVRMPGDVVLIEIYDMSGKRLLKCEADFDHISVAPLAAGIYNLKAISKSGGISCTRFVKDK